MGNGSKVMIFIEMNLRDVFLDFLLTSNCNYSLDSLMVTGDISGQIATRVELEHDSVS